MAYVEKESVLKVIVFVLESYESTGIVSKSMEPVIHFVIHHPKLRDAIENFVPPMVEKN